MLTKTPFSYRIIIAEQKNNDVAFSKGQLYNTAAKYAIETYGNVDCIVLHDIDIIPMVEDGSLDYRCRIMPWHLSKRLYIQKQSWDRGLLSISNWRCSFIKTKSLYNS